MNVDTYRGKLVILREPIAESDGPIRSDWFGRDPEGVHSLFVDDEPQADQVGRIRFELADPARWIWTLEVDEAPVGFVQLSKTHPDHGMASISYYVSPDHRGRHYGSDAVHVTVEKAHSLVRAVWLQARILAANDRSIGIVKAEGFTHRKNSVSRSGELLEVWMRALGPRG